jgi:hypothetical protein
MNADRFLRAFGASFFEPPPWKGARLGATPWTDYMAERIWRMAHAEDLHLCTTTGRVIEQGTPAQLEHWRREYLFDFTMYSGWEDYSLPAVIIEHENEWRDEAFMLDFWKLMMGFAPLRVMLGYAGNQTQLEQRVRTIRESARLSGWSYPQGVEDLVLLRSPDMDTKTWCVLSRDGAVWRDRTWEHL